jgi:hypothetical protein
VSLAVFREANLENLSILVLRDGFYHSAFVLQKPNRTMLILSGYYTKWAEGSKVLIVLKWFVDIKSTIQDPI